MKGNFQAMRTIRRIDPTSEIASKLLVEYMTDIVSRWYRRPATSSEIAEASASEPADDLAAPSGYLAAVFVDDRPVGVGGIRYLDDGCAELTKVFVLPGARGTGVGSELLDHLETLAAQTGCTSVQLDTRSDLVEACRLYERRGYRQVPPYAPSAYSDRWYRLTL
jgi:GNAT superfamily N-acetyltransferase